MISNGGFESGLEGWRIWSRNCVVAHWYWGDYNNKLPALGMVTLAGACLAALALSNESG